MAITFWLMLAAIAVVVVPTIMMNNALRFSANASGSAQRNAQKTARRAWWAVAALTLVIATLVFSWQPGIIQRFTQYMWGPLFPVLALAGLIGVRAWDTHETEWLTFLASAVYIFGVVTTAIFIAFPV